MLERVAQLVIAAFLALLAIDGLDAFFPGAFFLLAGQDRDRGAELGERMGVWA
ncbi:hypothetical protein [Ensifer sp.]|jgi:hypothetical protein|uniref:hypothetical protein n=1 Tax=Ensifer sp. TaxID=1872086 RepID=UPI002E1424D4|nr:hypothetical protein [Ensifer sp.]